MENKSKDDRPPVILAISRNGTTEKEAEQAAYTCPCFIDSLRLADTKTIHLTSRNSRIFCEFTSKEHVLTTFQGINPCLISSSH